MIHFVGTSHAPRTLAAAAVARGCKVTTEPTLASLIFVSEDTPTDENGRRNTSFQTAAVRSLLASTNVPIVLTSQVPPGFTRSFNAPERLIHMAETLRMKDAPQRALNPEQFIIGVAIDTKVWRLPRELQEYCHAHKAPMLVMSYEEAELSKIAINMFLAAQVDITNKLAEAARKVGAAWGPITQALRNDRRIGPHSYLEPGRWQDSRHLLRDSVTLEELLAR